MPLTWARGHRYMRCSTKSVASTSPSGQTVKWSGSLLDRLPGIVDAMPGDERSRVWGENDGSRDQEKCGVVRSRDRKEDKGRVGRDRVVDRRGKRQC